MRGTAQKKPASRSAFTVSSPGFPQYAYGSSGQGCANTDKRNRWYLGFRLPTVRTVSEGEHALAQPDIRDPLGLRDRASLGRQSAD